MPAILQAPQRPVATPVADMRQEPVYKFDDLLARWGGRLPRTEMVLPDSEQDPGQPIGRSRTPTNALSRDPASAVPAAAHADLGEILIPGGRGVFAHPVLAVNSDLSSDVVFEADTGPIAGDRMKGSFSRQEERLVIHLSSLFHGSETIAIDAVVIAPETMEAGVASSVDPHYLKRFILPAAAAFVQGLGQAIATTTNTATVLSPFGGAAFATRLNPTQQLGVAAGVAAGQIGQTLNQAAPRNSTVRLDANVAVGVMFLADVVSHRR